MRIENEFAIDYNKHKEFFNEMVTMSHFISQLKIGDKFGKSGYRKYFIYDASITQGVRRWWNNEDKVKTLEYLREIFDSYFFYLSVIINIYAQNKTNNAFTQLVEQNKNHQLLIMTGIENMLKTYEGNKDICDYLEKIKAEFNGFIASATQIRGSIGGGINMR